MRIKKNPPWRSHILMSKTAAFQKKDRELMLRGFEVDLDHELKKARPGDWIEIRCFWRNVGKKTTDDYTHDVRLVKKKK